MRTAPVKPLTDIAFITGIYAGALIVVAFASWLITSASEDSSAAASFAVPDVIFLVSTLGTVATAAWLAGARGWYPLAFVVPVGMFVMDIYLYLGANTSEAFQLLNRLDFWSFLTVAMLLVLAFLRRGLKKHEYLALAGWGLFVLGHLLIFGSGMVTIEYGGFIPLFAALALWIPALWIGSRQSSSR